jgi:DNA repair protein RadC
MEGSQNNEQAVQYPTPPNETPEQAVTPEQGSPVTRHNWSAVKLFDGNHVSEVLGYLDGPQRPAMRVYEATLQYNLISLGEDLSMEYPKDIYHYMSDIMERYPMNETFWVVMLNRRNKAIARHLCTLGTLSSALVHPREVFRPALVAGAAAVIAVHNHPSGDPAPSSADLQITRQLCAAARAVEILLTDHVIVGRKESDPSHRGYYSFREAGLV